MAQIAISLRSGRFHSALGRDLMRNSLLRLTTVAAILLGCVFPGSNFGTRKRYGAMRRPMEGCQGRRDDERRKLAAGPCAVPCPTENRGSDASADRRARPIAPGPTNGQAPTTEVKRASQCDAEYAANNAAIRAAGQSERAFVAACRAGNETIPQGAATAPAPAPAPTTGSLLPGRNPPPLRPRHPRRLRPRPRRRTAQHQRQLAQASPRPTSKRALIARPIPSSGSTQNRGLSLRWDTQLREHERGCVHVRGRRRAAGDRAAMNKRHP